MTRTADRRRLPTAALGFSATGLLPRTGHAAPVQEMEIIGWPNGSTMVPADLIDSGRSATVAPGATFRSRRTTDDLRAGIVSGRTRLFSTPSHVPANLAARGLPLKMLCLLGMGYPYAPPARFQYNRTLSHGFDRVPSDLRGILQHVTLDCDRAAGFSLRGMS